MSRRKHGAPKPGRTAAKRASPPGSRIGTCPDCAKQSFPSKADVKRFLSQHFPAEQRLRPYPCPAGHGWYHYGHLPPAVVRGATSIDNVRKPR